MSGSASRRRWDRDQTKAGLARTAEMLWAERQVFRRTEALRWRRRFMAATLVAFLAGAVVGATVSRVPLDTGTVIALLFRP